MEVGGRLHAPVALPAGGESPVTHLTGDWVGSRAGLDEVPKRKSPPLLRTPVVQPIAQSLY